MLASRNTPLGGIPVPRSLRRSLRRRASRVMWLLACAGIATGSIAHSASAGTIYWDGSSSNSWNLAANWSTTSGGGSTPGAVPGASDDVIFNASGTITNQIGTLGASQSVNSLTFNTASAITIANNTLTIGGGTNPGITLNSGAGADTISSTIALASSQTWLNNSGNTFAVSGGISNKAGTSGTQTLTIDGSSATTFSGVASNGAGTLALTKNGTGTFTISNALQTYTGATTFNGGTTQLAWTADKTNIISSSSALVFAGGKFAYSASGTNNNLTQTYASATVSPGASNFTSGQSGGSAATVTDFNTITRSVAGGTLDFNSGSGGTFKTKTANAGGNGILAGWATFGGSSWAVSAGNGTTSGNITSLSSFGTSYSTATTTTNFDATTSGTFTPTSINSIRFNNSSSARTATLNGAFSIGTGGILVTDNTGALLSTITGGTSLTSGNGADLIVNQFNASGGGLTIASKITGSIGLTKSGPGLLTLTSTSSDFSGAITLNDGTLSISANTNLGAVANNIVMSNNADLQATATFALDNGTTKRGITLGTNGQTGSGGTIDVASPNVFTVSGVVTGAGALTKTGTGTLAITGATNDYAGGTTVNGGTLNFVSGGLSSGAIALTSGTLQWATGNTQDITSGGRAVTFGGGTLDTNGNVVSFGTGVSLGSGGVTKAGAGTLEFAAANTYTGATAITGGVLELTTSTGLPGGIGTSGGTSNLTLNGGVLGLGSGNFLRNLGTGVTAVQWTGSGGFAAYGANRVVLLNNSTGTTATWASSSFVPNLSVLILGASDADAMVDFQNPINLANANRTIQVDDGSAAIDAKVSGVISSTTASSGILTKTGGGALWLTNANTYTGGTNINAGMLIVGNNSALSSAGTISNSATLAIDSGITLGRAVTFNNGSTLAGKGSYTPGSSITLPSGVTVAPGIGDIGTLSIGNALTFNSGDTFAVGVVSDTTDVLAITGNASLAGTITLSASGSQTLGKYALLTTTGTVSGTFGTVTGTPSGYRVVYASNEVDLTHKATIGTITASPSAASVITGGSTAFTFTVQNSAPANSDVLTPTFAAVTNISGTASNGTINPNTTSGSITGFSFNSTGAGIGAGRTGTFSVTDSTGNVTNSPQTGTVTVDVYDHASPSIIGGTVLTIPDVILGYGSAVGSSNTLTFNNASGFRVNLKSTNNGPLNSLSTTNLSALTAGSNGTISGSLATGKGVGSFSQGITLTYADDSSLNGASSNLGTQAVTVSGNVYDHASGSVGGTTLTIPDVFVGYASPVASSNSITVANAAGFRVNLKTTNNGPLGSISVTNVTAITPGNSGTITGSLATGKAAGAFSQGITITYADDSALGGASSNVGTQAITVTGNVYNHASGSVGGTTLTIPDVIVGYGSAVGSSNSISVTDASGFRVNLKTTSNSLNSISLNNVSAVTPGSSGSLTGSLATGKGVGSFSQGLTLTYADDSAISGASSNLGTQAITVSGNVFDHASASLVGGSALTIPDVIVGYGSAVGSSNSLTFNNASGFRVNLKTTNNGPLSSLSTTNISALTAGSNGTITGSLATGKGVGSFSQGITLTYADDSALAGASSNLGTQAVTLSGNIYDHASASLVGGSTLTIPDAIVGYGSAIGSSNSLTFNNASGFRVNLKTTNNGPLSSLSTTNLSALTAGSNGTITGSLATGKGVGSFSQGITLTYADDSALAGANSNLGTQAITLTGNVFDHASASLVGGSTLTIPDAIVGYGSAIGSSNSLTFNNASGFRVNLKTTNNGPIGSLSTTNISALTAGSNGTITGSLATGKGVGNFSQGITLTYADDSALAGASSNLGTQAVTLTGNIYDHASASVVGGTTLTIPDVIVGYGSAVGSSNSLTFNNASGFRVNLKTTNNGPLNLLSVGNLSGVVANSNGTVSGSLATGKGLGSYNQTITLTYADDSALAGASSNLGTQNVNVTGNVLDHASPSLSITSHDFGKYLVGTSPTGTNVNLLNASGSRANLVLTGVSGTGNTSALTRSGSSTGSVAAGGSLSNTLGLVTTASGSFSANYAYDVEDQAIPGATDLTTQNVAVTGMVYEAASLGHNGTGGFTNAAPSGALRSDAFITSATFAGAATTQGHFTAHTGTAVAGGAAFNAVTFDTTLALNGTHRATFFVSAQNDQTITGAAANDIYSNTQFEATAAVTGHSAIGVTYDAVVESGKSLAGYGLSSGTTNGGNGAALNTAAKILDGVASGDVTLEMSFTRKADDPSLPSFMYSDVLHLDGIASQLFTLEMSYKGNLGDGKAVFLGYLDNAGNWVNAVLGNSDGGATAFNVGNQAYNPLTDFHLGYYGYNTATHTVWAVVDHNSEFAVIPTPAALPGGLMLLSIVGITARRRKN